MHHQGELLFYWFCISFTNLNWLKCNILINVTDFTVWEDDGYRCQTVKSTLWVMTQRRLSFVSGFTFHRVNMTTCCNTVECHWENTARDLVFCPHPSITAPSALINGAPPACRLTACRKWLTFTSAEPRHQCVINSNNNNDPQYTRIPPNCP